jgi:hypothetical protein
MDGHSTRLEHSFAYSRNFKNNQQRAARQNKNVLSYLDDQNSGENSTLKLLQAKQYTY